MNNITISEVTNLDGSIIQWVQIDRGNGEFTSMPKSVYDEMLEKQNQGVING